jgi:hypothetical protein
MLTGTVSDFDSDGLFGLINADDGRLSLFNLRGTPPRFRELCRIGTRVGFREQECSSATRAVSLVSINVADESGPLSLNSSFQHL